MKKKILICAANPQSFQNITLICETLNTDQFDIVFADFRKVYFQDFVLPRFVQNFLDFSVIGKNKPFYLLSVIKKLAVLLVAIRKYRQIDVRFDICLLGDFGILEYYLVKTLKPTRTILIQDAILLWAESSNVFKKFRRILYGFKPRYRLLDEIYCSGDVTKRTLVTDGASSRIIRTIGIPRFQTGLKKNEWVYDEGSARILLLGEAYSWHGRKRLQNMQYLFLEQIDKLKYPKNLKFTFRKHPRDFETYRFNNIVIEDPKSVSLTASINDADVVVNHLMPSTVIFEIMRTRIPIIFVKNDSMPYSKMTNWTEFNRLFPVVSEADFLKSNLLEFLEKRGSDQELMDTFFRTNFDSATILNNHSK